MALRIFLPRALLFAALAVTQTHAFAVTNPTRTSGSTTSLAINSPSRSQLQLSFLENEKPNSKGNPLVVAGLTAALAFSTLVAPALAISGGGLDYSGTDISGQDFSNGNYKGKDFSQGRRRSIDAFKGLKPLVSNLSSSSSFLYLVIAKATTFSGSNLQGCRFFKAYLVRTDFTGADLRGVTLEDTSMDEAVLKDTVAAGAYFSASINDVATLENADFSDALIPTKTLDLLCQRPDAKGTNPTTSVDTRESLMCP